MVNPYFTEHEGRAVKPKRAKLSLKRAAPVKFNEGTAAWPGLPGKGQPKDRSAGVTRIKDHPKSEGL